MPEGTAAQQTYYVRVEYPVVAYATAEIEAKSPAAAAEQARELDQAGELSYDEDHETLAQEITLYVFEDEEDLRQFSRPVLVEKSRHEALCDAGQELATALKAVIGYARSRAEDMHETAEESGDAADLAAWQQADAAVWAAEEWLKRLAG